MTIVDVLVVNYAAGELTRAAVMSVAGPDTCVWVWDNSGDCPRDLPATLLGSRHNLFFAAANNRLLTRGSAEWVLLMNPDVTVAPETILELLTRLKVRPDCWGATTRLVGVDGADQNYLHSLPSTASLLADRLPPLRLLFRSAFRRYRCLDVDVRSTFLVEQPPAALVLLRRADVSPELFDESYPLFFNDVDLARRLGADGRRCLYAGDLTATHIGGASVRSAARRGEPVARMYDDALLLYARRHLRGARLIQVAVWLRRVLDRLRGGAWR